MSFKVGNFLKKNEANSVKTKGDCLAHVNAELSHRNV